MTFPAPKIILKGDKFDSEYMHHTSVIHFVDMWSNTLCCILKSLKLLWSFMQQFADFRVILDLHTSSNWSANFVIK